MAMPGDLLGSVEPLAQVPWQHQWQVPRLHECNGRQLLYCAAHAPLPWISGCSLNKCQLRRFAACYTQACQDLPRLRELMHLLRGSGSCCNYVT